MAAFPTRTSVDGIGPKMDNIGGTLNERRTISPRRANVLRWIAAGCSRSTNRAWCFVRYVSAAADGVVIDTGSEGSAWQGAAPTVARTAQGIYTVTYAASYVNESDEAVAPNLIMAIVSPGQNAARLFGDWAIASGRIVTVRLVDSDNNLTDGSFGLAVW